MTQLGWLFLSSSAYCDIFLAESVVEHGRHPRPWRNRVKQIVFSFFSMRSKSQYGLILRRGHPLLLRRKAMEKIFFKKSILTFFYTSLFNFPPQKKYKNCFSLTQFPIFPSHGLSWEKNEGVISWFGGPRHLWTHWLPTFFVACFPFLISFSSSPWQRSQSFVSVFNFGALRSSFQRLGPKGPQPWTLFPPAASSIKPPGACVFSASLVPLARGTLVNLFWDHLTKDSLNLWFLTGPPEWQRLLKPGAEGKLPGPAFASVCSGALRARTEPELIGEGNKWNSPLGAQALQKRCLVSNSEWPGANDLLPELGYLLLIMGPVTVATELLEVITECIHSKRWEQSFPRENSSNCLLTNIPCLTTLCFVERNRLKDKPEA